MYLLICQIPFGTDGGELCQNMVEAQKKGDRVGLRDLTCDLAGKEHLLRLQVAR